MSTNGKPQKGFVDPILINRLQQTLNQIRTLPIEVQRQFGNPFRRKDIYDECDYPKTPTTELFQTLYEREPIAARVVEVWPKECWQVTPEVYELEDTSSITQFEEEWDVLGRCLKGTIESHYQDEEGSAIWEYLLRADILSGIGHYGVILFGMEDEKDLASPVPGVIERFSSSISYNAKAKKFEAVGQQFTANYALFPDPASRQYQQRNKLKYLRTFPESLAYVSAWESNPSSIRYCKPTRYSITFYDPSNYAGIGAPMATKEVHWTRIQHISDTFHQAGSNESINAPRMRVVLNNLLNIMKISGASPEGYWRNAFTKLFIQSNPQLGSDPAVNLEALRDMMERMGNGLQQWAYLGGAQANPVGPTVLDPSPHMDKQIEEICIILNIPVRIFKGSERGELASSQDEREWRERKKGRRKNYMSPSIIQPFIDHCILLGILPTPAKGYSIDWPKKEGDTRTDSEKLDSATKIVTVLKEYLAGGCEALMTPMDLMTRVLDFDEDEARAILARVIKAEVIREEQAAMNPSPTMPQANPNQPPNNQPPQPPNTPPNQNPNNPSPNNLNPAQNLYVENGEGWVTKEDGQHLYISEGGEVLPSGPSSSSSGGKSSPPTNKGGKSSSTEKGKGYKVKYPDKKAKENFQKIVGEKLGDDEVTELFGFDEGSDVEVLYATKDKAEIALKGEGYGAERVIRKLENGDIICENQTFIVEDGYQGNGIGSKVFAQQVEKMAIQGVSRIEAEAAGIGEDLAKEIGYGNLEGYNGFYTWARLGYDGEIPSQVKSRLPKKFKNAKRVSDLMKTKEGREYWKRNGMTFKGTFDLAQGSYSRQVLAAYLQERGK